MNVPILSVVIPVYNEEASLQMLFDRLYPALDALAKSYEIIFVNDGSRDRSAAMLTQQHKLRTDVTRVILFNGNFGQHLAILAGFEHARGTVVVTLDADTLVLQNVDDLFERPPFAAGPDFFLPDHFNSGVMVVEPDAAVFRKMVEQLLASGSYDGGDQGFLNVFYGDWYAMPVEHRLPVGYNMAHFIYQFLRGHPTLKRNLEKQAKIIHYMVQKPWQAHAVLTGGSAAWWQRYFEVHPEQSQHWRDRVHELEDWTFDHVAALVLGG